MIWINLIYNHYFEVTMILSPYTTSWTTIIILSVVIYYYTAQTLIAFDSYITHMTPPRIYPIS